MKFTSKTITIIKEISNINECLQVKGGHDIAHMQFLILTGCMKFYQVKIRLSWITIALSSPLQFFASEWLYKPKSLPYGILQIDLSMWLTRG